MPPITPTTTPSSSAPHPLPLPQPPPPLTHLPTTPPLTAQTCLQMLLIRTLILHTLHPSGVQAPLLPQALSREAGKWCREVLRLDERKRQVLEGVQREGMAHAGLNEDWEFLGTFGSEGEMRELRAPKGAGMAFLRLMFHPKISTRMHNYLDEVVQKMLNEGSSQEDFIPLLWVGLRDWDTSSAWTRGVVLLCARKYKEIAEEGLAGHEQTPQQRVNAFLTDLGLSPAE